MFLRVALRRHRRAAGFCALVTALVGALVWWSVPALWRVDADLYVAEPTTIHRLANPFAAVPDTRNALRDLPEQLTSKEQLVALVKRVGLVDQWQNARPLPLRLKDHLLEKLRGTGPSDEDVLDALVAMLDKRLDVGVTNDHVRIGVEWPSREVAFGLVEASVGTLQHLRENRDAEAVEAVARSLDDQLAGVQAEVGTRAERIRDELTAAAASHRSPSIEADVEQLRRDQSRAADLMVRAEEKHIAAEIMRRSNALRFVLVTPAMRPKKPLGPGLPLTALLLLVTALASGLGGAVALSIAGGRLMSSTHVTREVGLPVVAAAQVDMKGSPLPVNRGAVVLVTGLAVATGVAFGLSRGNLAIAVAPLVVALVAWGLWSLPLKWPLLALMLAVVTLDDPSDRPYYNLWRSPLYPAGKLFFSNIAWFTGFEFALLGLLGLMFLRRLRRSSHARRLDPLTGQAPRVLRLAVLLSGATVVWLLVYGVARGGIFREALWQFRVLAMMPVVCTLAMHSFEFPKDLKWLLGVLVVGSLVKACLGAFFMYAVAYPQGQFPPHTTGHNDTMIFVTASIVCFLVLWEKPTWRHLTLALGWMVFVGIALRLNDRRIAYVDIAVSLTFIYFVSPRHRMKRFVTQAAVASLPLLLIYFAVGWNAKGGVFRPVQKIRSIVAPPEDTEEESSNVERDIENFNILKSWERDMLFGQGFGHAFTEFLPSNDFAQSNFGHIGHNSILWLMWIGGMVGFTCVTSYLAVAAFLFARALRKAQTFDERVALQTALCIMLTYVLQAFGDMGTEAIQFDFFVAAALGIIGRLAVARGAWPNESLVRPPSPGVTPVAMPAPAA